MPDCGRSATIDAMSQADLQPDAPIEDASPVAEQLHVPQFGILHLLIWTAVTAALLKLILAVTSNTVRQLQMPAGQVWAVQISQSVYAITLASTLVGSGVLIRMRCYRMLKRLQPGHWLVLTYTTSTLLLLAAWLSFWVVGEMGIRALGVYHIVTIVVHTLTAAIYVCAFVLLRDAKRWKVFLGAKALGDVTTMALSLVMLFAGFSLMQYVGMSFLRWLAIVPVMWTVATAVLLLAAAILDVWRRASRDWVHWLGVGVFGLTYVLSVALAIYQQFFLQEAVRKLTS